MTPITEGIIIGGAGGASAGIIFSLIKFCFDKITETRHRGRIYKWLKNNTKDGRL
jgi:shikimate 5-dehydrogenase